MDQGDFCCGDKTATITVARDQHHFPTVQGVPESRDALE
jgi:hypothetical protein